MTAASLLVAADGARSRVREQADIATSRLVLRAVGDRRHRDA